MDWTEDAIVLAARRHGESALVVSVLTSGQGRHAGLVHGGAGRRKRAIFEPGNLVRATWKARLAEQLGHLAAELVTAHAAPILDDPLRLAVLSSACAVVEVALPEREPHGDVYDSLLALIQGLRGEGFARAYVRWELDLLAELGFGLDLGTCAATGVNDDLAYVSPKSGRAVSAAAGEPYRDRLLPLPRFLLDDGAADARSLAQGLRLTGHFLGEHVFGHREHGAPAARIRLVERLSGKSGGR